MMDNRVFNVNGKGKEMLQATLQLAFAQEGSKTTAKAYYIDPKKGMLLLWSNEPPGVPFPAPLNADATTNVVWEWLQTNPEIEHESHWDQDYNDSDVDTDLGWRVYCEDWGHVTIGPSHSSLAVGRYAIVAVKPAYMWYGK